MKRKNLLLIACIALVLSLSIVFIACQENIPTPTPTPQEPKTYSISYEEVEGVTYSEGNPTSIKSGESAVFTFEVNVFYTGTPVVKVYDRERTISYDEDTYLYSCTLNNAYKDITVSISGITKAESQLLSSGTGTLEAPFLIKEPIDLIKMAEVINEGADNNTMSVLGYYSLEADLDFHGEQIEIIGDGSTDHSFFGGYFNGNGHTVSNFTIESENDFIGLFGIVQAYDLLGFSGGTIYNLKISDFTVTANNSGSTIIVGSMVGQGFGASMILCEAIDGEVEIFGDANHFSYAGGLIGLQRAYQYPFFSKVSYCSTTNVNVSCRAGTTFVAGGLVGYVYSEDESVVATVTNCYTTGNVTGAFNAGGIAGLLGQYTSIVNCYALGNISAQTTITDTNASEEYCHAYAGGLVGFAQIDTAIVDSFATGKMSAAASLGGSYAHTGEIVGRIEELEETAFDSNVASIFNCYYAPQGVSGEFDPTVPEQITSKLFWHDIDWVFESGKYPVINSVNSSSSDGEIKHYTYEITLDFGDNVVEVADGGESNTITVTVSDQYESMSFWYIVNLSNSAEGMPQTVIAKDGYTSYGYFFDKECTIAVPYGYTPTRNITLYGGFADYKEVEGTYYIESQADGNTNNSAIKLTISSDLSYAIEDAYGKYTGVYTYDGRALLFYSARFAKYYGASSLENQQSFTFKGLITDNGLMIFGGSYVDEETSEEVYLIPYESPLYARASDKAVIGSYFGVKNEETYIYTFYADCTGSLTIDGIPDDFEYSIKNGELSLNILGNNVKGTLTNGIPTVIDGVSLSATDKFKGTWNISSLSHKEYTFDGAGNWEYIYYGYQYDQSSGSSFPKRLGSGSGKYTVDGDKLVLDNGSEAYIGVYGLLVISKDGSDVIYGKENSYSGVWSNNNNTVRLELNGLTIEGNGTGRLVFEVKRENGRISEQIFDITYCTDTLDEAQICIYYQNEIYGILSYNQNTSALRGSFYNPSVGNLESYSLYRADEYKGEWIADTEDPQFAIINFNGYGSYTNITNIALKGIIVINGNNVEYTLDDATLDGYFFYNGERYSISYNEESNVVNISVADKEIEYTGKDVLGDKVFIDDKNNEYVFNGRGHLKDGDLVIGTKTYKYALGTGENVAVIYDGEAQVGTITIVTSDDGRNYSLNINGNSVVLGEKTAFTGSWAISGYYEDLAVIGSMNLDKHVKGFLPLNIDNQEKVHEADFIMKEGYLAWEVDESNTLYIIEIDENAFVLSLRLNWFNYDSTSTDETTGTETWNYSYLLAPDSLRGTWTNKDSLAQSYSFDGMGKNIEALGIYSVSSIYNSDDEETIFYYGYFTKKDGSVTDYVIVTSYGQAFKVVFCDYNSSRYDVYKNEATKEAFYLESVDLSDYQLIRNAEDFLPETEE